MMSDQSDYYCMDCGTTVDKYNDPIYDVEKLKSALARAEADLDAAIKGLEYAKCESPDTEGFEKCCYVHFVLSKIKSTRAKK